MCEFHALRDILSFSKKEKKTTKKKTQKKPWCIKTGYFLRVCGFYVLFLDNDN